MKRKSVTYDDNTTGTIIVDMSIFMRSSCNSNSSSNRFCRSKTFASTLFILSAIFYSPSSVSASSRRSASAPFTTTAPRNDFGLRKTSSSSSISSISSLPSSSSSKVKSKSTTIESTRGEDRASTKTRSRYRSENALHNRNRSRNNKDSIQQQRRESYDDYLNFSSIPSTSPSRSMQRQQPVFSGSSTTPSSSTSPKYNYLSSQPEADDYDDYQDRNNDAHANVNDSSHTEREEEEQRSSELLQVPLSLVLQQDSSSSSSTLERRTPMKTFIDTGAQVTIMTLEAAKKAGIAHLIDSRYAGHASGVAGVSCRVLGRIPARSISFVIRTEDGTEDVLDKSPAITVLEDRILGSSGSGSGGNQNHGGVDMLMGLDVLEEWKATLCLHERTLTVRDAKITVSGRCSSSKKSSSVNQKHNRNHKENSIKIPLMTKDKKTKKAFVPSQPESNKRTIDSSSFTRSGSTRGRDRSDCSGDTSTVYSYFEGDDYLQNHYSSGINSANISSSEDEIFQTEGYEDHHDEEEEYCDDNYYFAQSEDDFDECDLSGV